MLQLDYAPRDAFVPFHTRSERFGVIVAHRRAGKTVASMMELVDHALRSDRPSPRYAYVAPYYSQAKDVVWSYLKQFVIDIPGVVVSEAELRVDFPHNGARVRLYGADNYDRMRGIYLDGVVLDEFGDQPPQAWSEVIRPALADRGGWAVFIGTPKGKNGFWDIHRLAQADDSWYSSVLRASETGIIPEEELRVMRSQMTHSEYQREMECDFDAAVEGAYYAEHLLEARSQGRIGKVPVDPLMEYRTFWDIGVSDATAIWVAQFVSREIRLVDYYEAEHQPLEAHLNWLRDRGYEDASVWLPHDGARRDTYTAERFEDHIRAAGFRVRTIKNQGRGAAMKRVEAARRLFPAMWFNEETTSGGLAALAYYHEMVDKKRGIGLGPDHDWSSHAADAFGLLAVAYEEPRIKRTKEASSYEGALTGPTGWLAN